MYLRKIDYELLCKMKSHIKEGHSFEEKYYTKSELTNILLEKDPSINLENTFNYYGKNQLICNYSFDHVLYSGPDGSYYQELTVIGEAMLEQYEIDLKARLSLPEEANKIARFSNLIAMISFILSIISTVVSLIALFK